MLNLTEELTTLEEVVEQGEDSGGGVVTENMGE